MSEVLPLCEGCDKPRARTPDGREYESPVQPGWQWQYLLGMLRRRWRSDSLLGHVNLLEVICAQNGWALPQRGDVYTITEDGVEYEIRRKT